MLAVNNNIFRSASSSRNRSVERKKKGKFQIAINLVSPVSTCTLVKDSPRYSKIARNSLKLSEIVGDSPRQSEIVPDSLK